MRAAFLEFDWVCVFYEYIEFSDLCCRTSIQHIWPKWRFAICRFDCGMSVLRAMSVVQAAETFAENGRFAFHNTSDCEGVETGLTAIVWQRSGSRHPPMSGSRDRQCIAIISRRYLAQYIFSCTPTDWHAE